MAGQGGRGVHQGSTFGTGSGEGRSRGNVAQHSVRIHNNHAGQTVDVQVSLHMGSWSEAISPGGSWSSGHLPTHLVAKQWTHKRGLFCVVSTT